MRVQSEFPSPRLGRAQGGVDVEGLLSAGPSGLLEEYGQKQYGEDDKSASGFPSASRVFETEARAT